VGEILAEVLAEVWAEPGESLADLGPDLSQDLSQDLSDADHPSHHPHDHPQERQRRIALSEAECRALREEATQYYHRYMALLALQDFPGVVRDTTRNLRVIDLCARNAAADSDRDELEPFRPYIMMIRARAMASQALKEGESKAAVLAIDEGLDALRQHFENTGEPERFENSNEVQLLRGMRMSLLPRLPVSQRTELKQRLQEALASENYELAAILRDELRMLPEDGSSETRG
ncbi:MAG: UvrB/UvrC motif-containing protein, partial [Phycisphaerales bacterium JB037]